MKTDFHTHTFMSDGALLPAEHLRRAEVHGYEAIAITDHADLGNLGLVVPAAARACDAYQPHTRMLCVAGCEITHLPPAAIREAVERARALGARLVLVHGETSNEPVAPLTNRAAIESGCDLLAHPGFIREEDLQLAKQREVFVELTGKAVHGISNGRLVALNRRVGAWLIINGDSHSHGEFLTEEKRRKVGFGAGLTEDEYAAVLENQARLAQQLAGRVGGAR